MFSHTQRAQPETAGSGFVFVVAAFYASLIAILLWPREREAKEEFRNGEAGERKGE